MAQFAVQTNHRKYHDENGPSKKTGPSALYLVSMENKGYFNYFLWCDHNHNLANDTAEVECSLRAIMAGYGQVGLFMTWYG